MENKNVTAQLRETLFAALHDLQNGKMDTDRAHAISKISGDIIKTVAVEIQAAQVIGLNNMSSLNGVPVDELQNQKRKIQGGVVHKIK